MSNFNVSFMGATGNYLSDWTLKDFCDKKEAVDYIYDVISMCSEDEYLKTNSGGIKVKNISHWIVVED